MYYLFVENEKINGAGQCPIINEEIENIEVAEDIYNKYIETPNYYIYQDGEIVVNPNYEEEEAEQRREQFNKDFFNTSLGYIRRKVTMATGDTKDFLSDLLPTITMGVQSGMAVKVIAYYEPDFTKEIIDWEELQHNEVVTPQFIQECMLQLSKDFGVVNAN